jgi:release factor glutamine methyltransferase
MDAVNALVNRRVQGEPIAYLIGQREFYGLAFRVTPDVLIPRPDTEILVDVALQKTPRAAHVLDLGTGSGAIAIAMAHQRPDIKVWASDASPDALLVAQKNALAHHCTIHFVQSDWFSALPNQQWQVIVSNPPYIRQGDDHLAQGDLRYEPIDALTDHADGLSALRKIIQGAMTRLTEEGWLLVEHGYDQADAVRSLFIEQGFVAVQSWRDLAGIERVTGGRKELILNVN